jgi:5-methylcytosine-specific restriction protein A
MNAFELVFWINSLIQHDNIKAFYNSSLSLKVRDEVLREQHYECQRCKAKSLYSEAVTVHYKKYLRKYLALKRPLRG